jgi:choline dehydrogenase-like flavoprotein
MRAGLWRYLYKQLYWPQPAKYDVHVVAEQLPRRDNYIKLADERDVLDLPLAVINWRVQALEYETFAAFSKRFAGFWARRGLHEIGVLEWANWPYGPPLAKSAFGVDVFHPGGSTRMGANGRSAVVDQNLRTFAIPNLWIASTSVFPSGASANPTLMLMLFTKRLAGHLAQRLLERTA